MAEGMKATHGVPQTASASILPENSPAGVSGGRAAVHSMFAPVARMKSANNVPRKRCGLFKALVDSSHFVIGPDKRPRQFTVHDAARYPEAASKAKAICLSCKRTWDDVDSMLDAHKSDAELAEANEHHVVALWSDMPTNVAGTEPNHGLVVGLLSNEYGQPE